MQKLLFVCLGNICRSPLAEAAVRIEAAARGLTLHIDSAGTGGWHAGQAPDQRAVKVAAKAGVDISHLRARQVTAEDFETFDHIFALDGHNLMALREALGLEYADKLHLFGSFANMGSVGDPYYGDEAGFDLCWQDVRRGSAALLDAIESGAIRVS